MCSRKFLFIKSIFVTYRVRLSSHIFKIPIVRLILKDRFIERKDFSRRFIERKDFGGRFIERKVFGGSFIEREDFSRRFIERKVFGGRFIERKNILVIVQSFIMDSGV